MGYCTWAGMNEANRIYHDTEWGAACQWHAFSADRSGDIYSHLQACGIINDHGKECPCWQKIVNDYPTVNKRRDHEVK